MKIKFLRNVGQSLIKESKLPIPEGKENEVCECCDEVAGFLVGKKLAVVCDEQSPPKIAKASSPKIQGV